MLHHLKIDWADGHGRPDRDDLPHRPGQEGVVPDRQRGHQGALPDRRRLRHRMHPAGRRRLLDRRRVRAVLGQGRQGRQGRDRRRHDRRRQAGQVARPSDRDPPGQPDAAGRRPSTSSAPAATRASPSRRTAPSSTACSKAPSSWRTARMEMVDGNRVLRIVEFDVASRDLTGRTWLYPPRRRRRRDRRLQHDRRHDGAGHRARPGRRHGRQGLPRPQGADSPTASPTRPSSSASTRSR